MAWSDLNKKPSLRYEIRDDDAVFRSGMYSRWRVSDCAKDKRGRHYLEWIVENVDEPDLIEIIEMWLE